MPAHIVLFHGSDGSDPFNPFNPWDGPASRDVLAALHAARHPRVCAP